MKMPSLFRYFAVVGSALLGLLWIVNDFVDEPAPMRRAEATKIEVRHEQGASLIERWRDNEAAMKGAERNLTPLAIPTFASPEPAQKIAPASLTTTTAAAETPQVKPAKVAQPRKTQAAAERVKPPLKILAQDQPDARR